MTVVRHPRGVVVVGAVARTNPIPAGRYWLDVFTPSPAGHADSEAVFSRWLGENFGRVVVRTTETFPGPPLRNWYLFEVLAGATPTAFPFVALGFPTKAGPEVKSSGDTVQRPPPEAGGAVEALLQTLRDNAAVVAAIAVGVLFARSRR